MTIELMLAEINLRVARIEAVALCQARLDKAETYEQIMQCRRELATAFEAMTGGIIKDGDKI